MGPAGTFALVQVNSGKAEIAVCALLLVVLEPVILSVGESNRLRDKFPADLTLDEPVPGMPLRPMSGKPGL